MPNNNVPVRNLDISYKSIFRVILIILAFVFLYLIRDILLIFLVALLLSMIMTPWIDSLERKKIPRSLGVLFTYLISFGILVLVFILIFPLLSEQIGQLINILPDYLSRFLGNSTQFSLGRFEDVQKIFGLWGQGGLSSSTKTVFSVLGSVFGGIVGLVFTLAIALYMTAEKNGVKRLVELMAPKKYQIYLIEFSRRMQEKLSAWFKGQIFLCLVIGTVCYLGLTLIGVKYAILLGLIAGLFEVIPMIGPWLGGLPAFLIALIDSPLKALMVFVFYIILQECENKFLVPTVMKKATGLNPLLTISAVTIGATLAGIPGALIAIPCTAVIMIAAKDWFNYKKQIIKE